jgi:hypothetical protein
MSNDTSYVVRRVEGLLIAGRTLTSRGVTIGPCTEAQKSGEAAWTLTKSGGAQVSWTSALVVARAFVGTVGPRSALLAVAAAVEEGGDPRQLSFPGM